MKKVTLRQWEVYDYFASYMKRHGQSPLLREAASAFGISVASIQTHIEALERHGLVAGGGHRGIKLISIDDIMGKSSKDKKGVFESRDDEELERLATRKQGAKMLKRKLDANKIDAGRHIWALINYQELTGKNYTPAAA
jgi:SOS-response transcriptional repressor LexA